MSLVRNHSETPWRDVGFKQKKGGKSETEIPKAALSEILKIW